MLACMVARPQFSVRLMLAATAAVALLMAEATVFPDWLAAVVGVIVQILAPAAAVAGILYGRDYSRAFFIGALVGWYSSLRVIGAPAMLQQGMAGMLQYSVASAFYDGFSLLGNETRRSFAAMWTLSLAAGLLSVLVRWRFVSQQACGRQEPGGCEAKSVGEPQR